MSLAHGPKVVTDGLVLALDAADYNSLSAELTTNLVPQAVRQHTGGMSAYFSGVIVANNTEKGFPSFKVTTANNANNDGFIAANGGNLTNGVTYTISADVWVPAGKVVQIRQRNITGGSFRSGSSVNSSLTEQWQRISQTFVADTNTSGSIEGVDVGITTDVFTFWIKDLQLEEKSNATPFVDGTRSWIDISGNGNNASGVSTSNPSYSSANGGALVFDGVNDYVDCGNTASLSAIGGTTNITVSGWAYYTAYGGGGQTYSVITVKGTPWTWLLENPSNIFRFRITAGGADVNVADTSTHLLNTWYNVVGTYDGSNMRIYVNGVLKNTKAQTGTLATNSETAKIGTYQGTNYNLTGRVSNISIYNRALTADEISQNFNALRGRFGI